MSTYTGHAADYLFPLYKAGKQNEFTQLFEFLLELFFQ